MKKTLTQETLDTFTREVALLFFRMRQAATEYLGQGQHSSGRRSILKSLGELGPQTVPEMARARSVSRQHIQRIVDELKSDGLVRSIVDQLIGPHLGHAQLRIEVLQRADSGSRRQPKRCS